jgi:hypothetical protein
MCAVVHPEVPRRGATADLNLFRRKHNPRARRAGQIKIARMCLKRGKFLARRLSVRTEDELRRKRSLLRAMQDVRAY